MTQRSNRPVDWNTLVTENEKLLYRAALAMLGSRQEAEDAVQDAFVTYLEKAPADLREPSAWLMRVLVNRCRDMLRSPRRGSTLPLWEDLSAPGPEERQELEELYALPPKDRAVIHLHYCEGWPTADIARILGVREGTVRSRLSRARQRLRQLLQEEATGNE